MKCHLITLVLFVSTSLSSRGQADEWSFFQNAEQDGSDLNVFESSEEFPSGAISGLFSDEDNNAIAYLENSGLDQGTTIVFGFTSDPNNFGSWEDFDFAYKTNGESLLIYEGGELISTMDFGEVSESIGLYKNGEQIEYLIDDGPVHASEVNPAAELFLQVLTYGAATTLSIDFALEPIDPESSEGNSGDDNGTTTDGRLEPEDPEAPTAPSIPPAYTSSSPVMRNYQHSQVYSNGLCVAESRTYVDKLGRHVQSLHLNKESGHVIATENKFDEFGRQKLKSLPFSTYDGDIEQFAPNAFEQRTDISYTYEEPGEGDQFYVTYPISIGNKGSAGWYYSESNYEDNEVASSPFPFIQYEYFPGTGEVQRMSLPGRDFKIGSGRENRSYRTQIIDCSALPGTVQIMIPKHESKLLSKMSKDADGNEVTIYKGKNITITKAGSGAICDEQISWKFEYFDDFGQLTKLVPPEAFICDYVPYNQTNITDHYVNKSNLLNNTSNVATTVSLSSYPDDLRDRQLHIEVTPNISLPSFVPNPVTGTQSPSPNDPLEPCENNIVSSTTLGGGVIQLSGLCPHEIEFPSNNTYVTGEPNEGYTYGGADYEYGAWGFQSDIRFEGTLKSDGSTVTINPSSTFDFYVTSTPTEGHQLYYYQGFEEYFRSLNSTTHNIDEYSSIKIYVENFKEAVDFNPEVGPLLQTYQPVEPDSYILNYLNSIQVTVRLSEYSESKMPTVEANSFTYNYDDEGRVTESHSPDVGTVKYIFNPTTNRTQFSQNAKQELDGSFSYILYDKLQRVVETGEYRPPSSGQQIEFVMPGDPNPPAHNYTTVYYSSNLSLPSSDCYDRAFYTYDETPDDFPASLNSSLYSTKFSGGRITRTKNAYNTTWYGYDIEGRLTWMVQDILGLGIKTLYYNYNAHGVIGEAIYQREVSAERLHHHFNYDNNLRLKTVSTSTNGSSNFAERARYEYYEHGPLKRVVLGKNAQGMDYLYTIQGWLKYINDPEIDQNDPGKDGHLDGNWFVSQDIFGLALNYFDNDYLRTDNPHYRENNGFNSRYNGLVASQSWKSKVDGFQVFEDDILSYQYSYDTHGELLTASLGTSALTSGNQVHTVSPVNDFKVNVGYDRNGNIESLKRNGNNVSGLSMDDLSYSYPLDANNRKTSNKLTQVDEMAPASPYTDDIESISNYQYNALGQLTTDLSKNVQYKYTPGGLLESVKHNSSGFDKFTYRYNEKGQKISQTSYNHLTGEPVSKTFYVYDITGNVMATYVQDMTTESSPEISAKKVYGQGRIGSIAPDNQSMIYEIKDHLGNVRAAITVDGFYGQDRILETFSDPQGDLLRLVPDQGYATTSYQNGVFLVEDVAGTQTNEGIHTYYPIGFKAMTDYKLSLDFHGIEDVYGDIRISITDASTGSSIFIASLQEGQNNLSFSTGINSGYHVHFFLDGQHTSNTSYSIDNVFFKEELEVVSATDYYPFGSPMPGRNYVSSNGAYSHGYQGEFSENDQNGLVNFSLRQFEPRLGRWFTPDPKIQYASAYLGMGNNPVSKVDPDGGRDRSPQAIINSNGPSPGELLYLEAFGNIGGGGHLGAAWAGRGDYYKALDGYSDQNRNGYVDAALDADMRYLLTIGENTSFNAIGKVAMIDGKWVQNVRYHNGSVVNEPWTVINFPQAPGLVIIVDDQGKHAYVNRHNPRLGELIIVGSSSVTTGIEFLHDISSSPFYLTAGASSSFGEDYMSTLGLMISAAGEVGSTRLKSGKYKMLDGRIGNFNLADHKLSQWGKTNRAFAQNLSKVGKFGNVLVVASVTYDFLDDGNIKTSTAVNTALAGLAIAVPVTAPFVLVYGILDYAFDISETIDANSSGIDTGIYD